MSGAKWDNNLKGVLFKNIKDKDASPDYKGQCELGGIEYWIAGWMNMSKDRKPFMSLKFTAKDKVMDDLAKRSIDPVRAQQAKVDDEIPF